MIVLILEDDCDTLLIPVPVSTTERVAVVEIENEIDKLLREDAE